MLYGNCVFTRIQNACRIPGVDSGSGQGGATQGGGGATSTENFYTQTPNKKCSRPAAQIVWDFFFLLEGGQAHPPWIPTYEDNFRHVEYVKRHVPSEVTAVKAIHLRRVKFYTPALWCRYRDMSAMHTVHGAQVHIPTCEDACRRDACHAGCVVRMCVCSQWGLVLKVQVGMCVCVCVCVCVCACV